MTVEEPYEVYRTSTADKHLEEIVRYVQECSGIAAALRVLDRIEEACEHLALFPRLGAVSRRPTLARRGYRMLVVGRYLLVYKVDDAARRVLIHGIFYYRQEYQGLL